MDNNLRNLIDEFERKLTTDNKMIESFSKLEYRAANISNLEEFNTLIKTASRFIETINNEIEQYKNYLCDIKRELGFEVSEEAFIENYDLESNHTVEELFKEKSMDQLLELSRKGNVEAQCKLGIIYYEEENVEEAKIWLEKSANEGNIEAQSNLGAIYLLEGNNKEAKVWLEKSGKKNNMQAQVNLAIVYFLENNIEEAKKWYEKAVYQGYRQSKDGFGIIDMENEEFINKETSMDFVDEQKDNIKELYEKATNEGDIESQIALGTICYKEGNIAEAKKWLEKAANQGSVEAQNNLGNIYFLEGNNEEAKMWLEKAASQGYEEAITMFNVLYMY